MLHPCWISLSAFRPHLSKRESCDRQIGTASSRTCEHSKQVRFWKGPRMSLNRNLKSASSFHWTFGWSEERLNQQSSYSQTAQSHKFLALWYEGSNTLVRHTNTRVKCTFLKIWTTWSYLVSKPSQKWIFTALTKLSSHNKHAETLPDLALTLPWTFFRCAIEN